MFYERSATQADSIQIIKNHFDTTRRVLSYFKQEISSYHNIILQSLQSKSSSGSSTLPRKIGSPVGRWIIATTNGLSKVSSGGARCTLLLLIFATVAAAASVPSSVTSIAVECSTSSNATESSSVIL